MGNDELIVTKIVGSVSDAPGMQIFGPQVLARTLTCCEFEFGLKPHDLSRFRYAAGEIILCRRNTEEWVRWLTPVEMLLITLPDGILQSVAAEMGVRASELNGTPRLKDERVLSLATAVGAEYANGSPAGRIYMDSIARALAAVLLQPRGSLPTSMRKYHGGLAPAQLRRVTSFVHEHLNQDMSLSQLAGQANLSSSYFSEMFRQSTGIAPHQFVLRARVQRARELLGRPGLSVLDVALECGFQSQQHFARVFRAISKMSPSQFRRLKPE